MFDAEPVKQYFVLVEIEKVTPPFKKTKPLEGRAVLVAEDCKDSQLLISTILTTAGAAVELAENGLVAIEKAIDKKYDVIILDIQMPIKDGFSVTQYLKESGHKTPVIGLTAQGPKLSHKECLFFGFDDFLLKPFNRHELVSSITGVLSSQIPV